MNGAPVTVSGGEVLAADITDAMKWLFTTDGNGFDVTNGSDYLNRRAVAACISAATKRRRVFRLDL